MSDRPKSINTSGSLNIVSFPGVFRAPEKQANSARAIQLEFALSGQRKLVIVATDKINGASFISVLSEIKPRVMLDLRYSPHFEFGGVSNAMVKAVISKLGSHYYRRSLPLHKFSENILRFEPDKLFLTAVHQAFMHEKIRHHFPLSRNMDKGLGLPDLVTVETKIKDVRARKRERRARYEGPLVVLVQNSSEINLLRDYLLSALTRLEGREWECSVIE